MHLHSLRISSLCVLATAVPTQWSTPTLVGSVNSGSLESGPSLTFDGLTLYFSRYGAPLFDSDIFRATRTTRYGPFGTPVRVGELSSGSEDWSICSRFDDREVIFSSQRPGGGGGGRDWPYDLWRADRQATSQPFNAPVPLLELNSIANEHGPSLTADGLQIYFASNRCGGCGATDIWTATRPSWGAPFGTPTPVAAINSSASEVTPRISADNLMIWFASDRFGGGGSSGYDLWMASRLDLASPFGAPVMVGELNIGWSMLSPAFGRFPDEVFFDRNGDIFSSRFTGLVGSGIAGPTTVRDLLFADPSSPGFFYVAASAFGSVPGIQIGARVLPLNPDPLLQLTVGGLPPLLTGYSGRLGNDGTAFGRLSFAGHQQLVGFRFVTAFVVLDPLGGIRTISNALETLVQ